MNTGKIALVALGLSINGIATAESPANVSNYHFRGDMTAMRACRAVVRDDVGSLQMLLSDIRQGMAHGYRFREISPEISGSITCNDMSLNEFSQQVRANSVSSFLASGGFVSREEMTAAAGSPMPGAPVPQE